MKFNVSNAVYGNRIYADGHRRLSVGEQMMNKKAHMAGDVDEDSDFGDSSFDSEAGGMASTREAAEADAVRRGLVASTATTTPCPAVNCDDLKGDRHFMLALKKGLAHANHISAEDLSIYDIKCVSCGFDYHFHYVTSVNYRG